MLAETEQIISLKNIDKSDWKKYRFDEVALNISERVDPNNTNLEVYIGLEHLDSESIHIRRFGEREDVNGQKLRFYPGDIIFGRRRAYQRKAGVANTDGFCSAHALVLRANSEIIEPALFPFFLHSDAFMHRAIDISVGSLSPTINWGTLKKQEFLLPPKHQQAEIAKLLSAIDEVVEADVSACSALEVLLNSYIKQVFTSHIIESELESIRAKSPFQTRWDNRSFSKGWRSHLLKDVILDSQSGFAEGQRDPDGFPQLRMNNVTRDGRIDLSSIAKIPPRKNIERYSIECGDVMFCNTNSEDLVGKSIIADSQIEGFSFSNHFTRLRPNESLLTPKFLYLWLKYHFDIGLFESRCTKWIGQAAVQTENLFRLHIVLPPLDEQLTANNYCENVEKRIDELKVKISSSKELQKSLINKVF